MIRLENTTSGHNKFYEIYQNGNSVKVRYGPIGEAGTILTKRFGNSSDAYEWVYKTNMDKLNNGYRRVSDQDWRAAYESSVARERALQAKITTIRNAIY